VQRWIANLLMCWMLLLLPGATALELAQPQMLLPACCRTHGAHHCSLVTARHSSGPAWQNAGCPYQHLPHAAILLSPGLPAAPAASLWAPAETRLAAAQYAALSAWLAGLPGSRAPPSLV
jgi:hypothetical protein